MGLPPCPSDSRAVGDTGTSLAPQAGPVVAVGPSNIMALVPQAGSEGERPAAPLPPNSQVSVGYDPVTADHLLPEWEACACRELSWQGSRGC